MKKLILTLALVISASAHATVDNSVEINLSATVGRACMVDLAPAAETQSLSTSLVANIALAPREEGGNDDKTITIYETCNENYIVNVKSLNGGLKHAQSDYVHNVAFTYDGGFPMALSMVKETPRAYPRSVDGSSGVTPYFEPKTLTLYIGKAAGLPKGDYSEVVTVEMATEE